MGVAASFEVAAQRDPGVFAFLDLAEGLAGEADVGLRVDVRAPVGAIADTGRGEGERPSTITSAASSCRAISASTRRASIACGWPKSTMGPVPSNEGTVGAAAGSRW
ncbi:hypothetical protein OG948_33635 [Embleya sp. NBC_00888]|uniref:hypothetical protein n=1 Tax=Embleya sp. NBC_00888 TaxID=2975960 RepID=UPI003867617F|nr:hypothetical protein OG948_33635 [Embleya sp. NBC_00888]